MLLVIALVAVSMAGMIVWYTMLRQSGAPTAQAPAPRRVVAPDDDPEFLRQLDQRLRHQGDDPPR